MNAQKLERANHIYNDLLPNIKVLENINNDKGFMLGKIGSALTKMVNSDEVFATAMRKLLTESKERLMNEFNEL